VPSEILELPCALILRIVIANHIPVISTGLREVIDAQSGLEFVSVVESGYQVEWHCYQLNPLVLRIPSEGVFISAVKSGVLRHLTDFANVPMAMAV